MWIVNVGSDNTPIYRYNAPLRMLFWLNNRDPFMGVKKRGNRMIFIQT